jgi:hypothetical protein
MRHARRMWRWLTSRADKTRTRAVRLVLAHGTYPRICELATRYPQEFAVTLFGFRRGEDCVVTYIAPPGKNAEQGYARCTGDAEHEAAFFEELQRKDPQITWVGDLHAHPCGLSSLSGRDLRTVREILLGTDDTWHPGDYVAGVMLRTRDGVKFYPRHFTKENLYGSEMEIRIVD